MRLILALGGKFMIWRVNMKFDLVRLKVPVCFLVMTLAALAVVVIMSRGEVEATDSDTTHIVQQSVVDGEEMNSLIAEEELLVY